MLIIKMKMKKTICKIIDTLITIIFIVDHKIEISIIQ